jgi:hypothetical protein
MAKNALTNLIEKEAFPFYQTLISETPEMAEDMSFQDFCEELRIDVELAQNI